MTAFKINFGSMEAKCTSAFALAMLAILSFSNAVVASDFKGKDFEELKKEYGLYDVEYTPEDEEEIMKEYPWISEESESIKQLLSANDANIK